MSTLDTPAPPIHGAIRTVRIGPVMWAVNIRVLLMVAVAFGLLLALAAWAMTLGSFPVPYLEVIKSVAGQGSGEFDFVVRTLRLPRVLVAIMVGACLAMSGAIFQGLLRNPLVSPDIIGINSGASTFVVIWIVIVQDFTLVPLLALLGATSTAALIYVLTWKGGISGNRMILVGMGVQATLGAVTTYVMIKFPIEQVSSAFVWSAGSVYASDWWDVRVLTVSLIILIPIAVLLMRPLRVLQFGDDLASGLGMGVERTRLALLFVGCALSAAAVCIAGPVGFVAFMVPHAARMLAGPMTGSTIMFTGILGAILLLGADVIGQHALPVALPVGVITGAIGGPYFLLLLWRSNVRL